jgi:hypothetical protein
MSTAPRRQGSHRNFYESQSKSDTVSFDEVVHLQCWIHQIKADATSPSFFKKSEVGFASAGCCGGGISLHLTVYS